jgi:hypothetical protein
LIEHRKNSISGGGVWPRDEHSLRETVCCLHNIKQCSNGKIVRHSTQLSQIVRGNTLMKAPNVHENQLLGAFTKETYGKIMPHMTEVDLKLGATVC